MADAGTEPAIDAVSRLVPATLKALARAGIRRPASLAHGAAAAHRGHARPRRRAGARPSPASRALDWPERLQPVRACLEPRRRGGRRGDRRPALGRRRRRSRSSRPIARCATTPGPRRRSIPWRAFFRPVSQFFLEQSARDDAGLHGPPGCRRSDAREGRRRCMPAARPARAAASRSMCRRPTTPARAYPLVVALHGGSGNGGAFLWSWLREARTRGFIVLAPTAIGSTWSLMDPDIDGPSIDAHGRAGGRRSGTSMPAASS